MSSCPLFLEVFRASPEPWKLGKMSGLEVVKLYLGQSWQVVPPSWCALFQDGVTKKASLANFTARMLILHSVLRVGYLRKISGTLFSVVLFVSDEGNSVNFGFVSAIGSGSGTSGKGDSPCGRGCCIGGGDSTSGA